MVSRAQSRVVHSPSRTLIFRCILGIAVGVAVGATQVQAASSTWNVDAAGAWNNDANWFDNVIPGSTTTTDSTDIATFDFTLTSPRTITVDANRNVGGIRLGSSSGNGYTLSGGPLFLTNGAIVETLVGAGPHPETISAPIFIQGNNGSITFSSNAANASNRLVISGTVSGQSAEGGVTTIILSGGNTSASNSISSIADGTQGGKIAVVKEGTGTWTFGNLNATGFSGGVTLNEGTLRLAAGNNSILGTGPLTLNGGTYLMQHAAGRNQGVATTIGGNVRLVSDRSSAGVGFTGGVGSLTIGAHTATFAAGSNATAGTAGFAFNGDVTLTGDAVFHIENGPVGAAEMLVISGSSPLNRIITNGHTLTLSGTGHALFRGATEGDGSLLKANDGLLTVIAENTHTGDTVIEKGTLVISNVESSVMSATSSAASTIITVEDTSTLTVGQAVSGMTAGIITGILSSTQFTVQIPITTAGTSNITLGATNGSLAGSTLDYQSTGGSVAFGGSTSSTSFGGLKGDKDLILENASNAHGAVELTLGGNDQSNTFTGVLSGAGSIVKIGEGAQTFTAENSYSGGTVILNGAILANSAVGSSLGSGEVSIGADGVLGGIGRVAPDAGNSVTVDGRIAPGVAGAGTLTFGLTGASQVLFNEGSILDFVLGTSSGLIAFDSTGDWLAGSGNVTLALTLGDGFSYDNSYVIFENVSTEAFSLAGVTGIDSDAWTYSFSKIDDNYVLSFTAVPEPSAMILAGLGLAALVFVNRRNRA